MAKDEQQRATTWIQAQEASEEIEMPKTVTILWNDPAAIDSGTALDDAQLCAAAKDTAGKSVEGSFDYEPAKGTMLAAGTHKLQATFRPADAGAYRSATKTVSIIVTEPQAAAGATGPGLAGASPAGQAGPAPPGPAGPGGTAPGASVAQTYPTVHVHGEVKFGKKPIPDVEVCLTDLDGNATTQTSRTDSDGRYTFDVQADHNVRVKFPPCVTFPHGGEDVVLHGPRDIYCRPCEDVCLPPTYYAAKGCQICGIVERAVSGAAGCRPLSGVTVTLRARDDCDTAGAQTLTDNDGRFCIFTERTGLLTVGFEDYQVSGHVLFPSVRAVDVFLTRDCPSGICLPAVVYRSGVGQLCGVVTDGTRGLHGVDIELLDAAGKCVLDTTTTDDNGLWTFPHLAPGRYQVRYADRIPGKSLELSEQQPQTQTFDLKSGDVKQAAPVSYQPEPHIIERHVLIGDQPADGILVDVRYRGAHSALQSARTVNGLVRFVLDEGGTYEVRVYPDPQAFGDPLVDVVEVHSISTSTTTLPASPGLQGSSRQRFVGGSSQPNPDPITDIAAYPVLTEEVGYPPSPLALPGGKSSAMPGTPALGQTVMKAISDVLGWQVKPDPKAFLGALNASFSLKETEGHTEATWTPRSYAVQTDLSGGITGAQASVYARAKEALDQSLPLLDGLYPLFKESKDEDVSALRATVRSQFIDLVNELGLLGGPRVARVTQLFFLLLGQQLSQDPFHPNPSQVVTDPDRVSGSLGNLRVEFGFSLSDDLVNTVQDEQNVTNFRIVTDYLTSLAISWLNNLRFFGLKTDAPFFGTQLVLLSRQLSVVAEKVNEVRFTLDSVFIGPADRQTLQIDFASVAQPMFLEDLFTWIDSFASEEGPRLIAEGGKFAVSQSFVPIATQLQQLAQGLLGNAFQQGGSGQPTNFGQLPPGFRTFRVQNSVKDLADSLQQLVSLATPIAHVITPEPEPALSVLGINPNVVKAGQSQVFITIIGTGFDVNNAQALVIQPTPALAVADKGILSDNLAFLKLNTSGLAGNSTFALKITMTNRNNTTASLTTGLTVLPP